MFSGSSAVNQVEVILLLPEDLATEAQAAGILNKEEIARLIADELQRREDELEARWEASLHKKNFAAAFHDDGTVDFDLLMADAGVVPLEDLKPDQ
jgi:hypothetical protein